MHALTADEGGRRKPFFTGYRPQAFFRTADVPAELHLLGGVEMVLPGDTVLALVELGKPLALHEGLGFALREGGRTVAAGTVTKLLD